MPRFGHAVLGGTFDHLHVGHEALLAAAFHAGRSVSVGVTTDRFLAEHPKPGSDRLQPYSVRVRALRRWLARRYPGRAWRTVPLGDRFGRSVGPGVDVLVVSVDTLEGGRAVNAERRRRGFPTVPLVVVPVVLADDLGPVSSRRIRSGEIDAQGHRRAPIVVTVWVEATEDATSVAAGVRDAFPTARVVRARSPAVRPRSAPPRLRARRAARDRVGPRDFAVAVVRSTRGVWWVVERSAALELAPCRLSAVGPAGLRRAVRDLLRPSRGTD